MHEVLVSVYVLTHSVAGVRRVCEIAHHHLPGQSQSAFLRAQSNKTLQDYKKLYFLLFVRKRPSREQTPSQVNRQHTSQAGTCMCAVISVRFSRPDDEDDVSSLSVGSKSKPFASFLIYFFESDISHPARSTNEL